jgi:tRNA(Ile)-lysidine synthase
MLAWRGAELRRYREQLFAMPPAAPRQDDWSCAWDGATPLALPAGSGCLLLEAAGTADATVPATPFAMRVQPRRGGERIAQPGAHRELRTLLQDLGVPPWVRARLPLLFDESGALAAAGDLALAPEFAARLAAMQRRLRWQRAAD